MFQFGKGMVNADFNNRTIPLLQAAGKDLQGAAVGNQDFHILHHVLVLTMILVVIKKQLKLEVV
jgi:hypothetical protein